MACGRGLHLWRCGPWAAGEWRTPPTPVRRLMCARVCVLGWGGAVSPLSPETWASSQPGSRVWAPSPLSPREDGSPLTHPNQEVLETSAPPKDLQCPRSLFSLSSSSQKPFLIFLSKFTASLHCIYLAVPHASSLHLLSARAQRPPRLCHLCTLGHTQASPREALD